MTVSITVSDPIMCNIPLVTQQLDLRVALTLDPVVTLTKKPQFILSSEEELLQQTATEQEHTQVSQDRAMTWKEARRVFGTVNIAAHHSVEISPANNEAKSDSTFVDSFDVVTRPRDRIGDAGIDTQGGQERSRIRNTGPLASDQHGKANETQEGASDIAQPTLTRAVSKPANSDGQDGRRSIWRNGKQLRFRGGIPEFCGDCQPDYS